jgi:hypothetical protein
VIREPERGPPGAWVGGAAEDTQIRFLAAASAKVGTCSATLMAWDGTVNGHGTERGRRDGHP